MSFESGAESCALHPLQGGLAVKNLIGLMVLAVIFSAGAATMTFAAGDAAVSGSQTIEGDVLKIEGEFYTVHDTTGHEVRVHVDKTTKVEGVIKTGDKVNVQVTDKGHALSVKRVHAAGGGMAALGPQTITGDVLKIEGEFYTVHDTAGHEVRVHVDKTTKQEGAIKVGDKVEVKVTEKAHALSIKQASAGK